MEGFPERTRDECGAEKEPLPPVASSNEELFAVAWQRGRELTAALRLTSLQRAVLTRLAVLDARNDLVGFNPCSFGGERAAASARGLAKRGFVSLSRVSERHLRYAITVAGLGALAYAPAEASPRQVKQQPRDTK